MDNTFFMDGIKSICYMRHIVKNPEKIKGLRKKFLDVIKLLKPIGKTVFRGSNSVFSTSLYDCVMIGVTHNLNHYKRQDAATMEARVKALKQSEAFKKASGSASASKSRIIKRIDVALEIFNA